MAKPKTDRNICRYCKLGPPQVVMALERGKPCGVCNPCRNAKAQAKRSKARIYKDFYTYSHALTATNYKLFCMLPLGVFTLQNTTTKASCGYLAVKDGAIFVQLWGEGHLLRPSRYGIATWLSDQGVLIDPAPIVLKDPSGAPVELSQVGAGYTLSDVAERLIMLDLRLQEMAYKRVKAEFEAERARAAGLTPDAEPPPKPYARMGQRRPGTKVKRKDRA